MIRGFYEDSDNDIDGFVDWFFSGESKLKIYKIDLDRIPEERRVDVDDYVRTGATIIDGHVIYEVDLSLYSGMLGVDEIVSILQEEFEADFDILIDGLSDEMERTRDFEANDIAVYEQNGSVFVRFDFLDCEDKDGYL